jgi:hypothetical protein
MISLDTMFFLVLAAFTIWYLSSIYLYTLVFLGKPHVHVGLDGDEGDGSVELLVVVGGGGGELLVNFSPRLKLHFFFMITLQSA